MTTLTLTPFVGLFGNLHGMVGRLLEHAGSSDDIANALEQLAVVDHDFTALVVKTRRTAEGVLERGVTGHEFMTIFGDIAADIKTAIPQYEADRKVMIAVNGVRAGGALPNFETLLQEMRALDKLLTEAFTLAKVRPSAAALEQARAAAAAGGPYVNEAEFMAQMRSEGGL